MLSTAFTLVLLLSPILSIYQTQIATLTLTDILLFALLPFLIMDMLKNKKLSKKFVVVQFLIIFLYMIFQLLFICLLEDESVVNKILMPTMRLLFYYFIVTFFIKSYFEPKKSLKILKYVATISSAFLLVQFFVLQISGKYIPGYFNIPGLSVVDYLKEHATTITASGRPRSFFLEPSHYAICCALYLGIDLIVESKKININNIIVTCAMVLSTSGTAIFLVIIIYLIYFIKNFKLILSKYSKQIILVTTAIIIILFVYSKTEHFQLFLNRTFINGDSAEGRFENYDLIFNDNSTNIIKKVFGNGILKIDDYIPSVPRIYFYFGAVGIIYFSFIFLKNLLKLRGINWISTLILFILMFPTELFFGNFILLYAPFIYLDYNSCTENLTS